MRLVYIAGPYRAATAWEVEQNIRRAEEIGLEIARMGAMPVAPHMLTRFYGGECTEDFWLLGTFMLMQRCDIVVLTPMWRLSSGAACEKDDAVRLGKPVFEWERDSDREMFRDMLRAEVTS